MIVRVRALVLLAASLGFAPGGAWAQTGSGADGVKKVLVLYGERLEMPAIRAVEQGLREQFQASGEPRVEWFSEYCDFARFPAEQHDANLVRYLRERYAGRRIDLVMPVMGFALEFVLRHRDELFFGAPVVFCLVEQREVDAVQMPEGVTGVAIQFDIRRTVDLALRLQPKAREIVYVAGCSGFDQRWAAESEKVLGGFTDRIRWRGIRGRSLRETVAEVIRVPRDDIVLFLSMTQDAEGRALTNPDVLREITPASAAPVYGMAATFLEAGIVGGALMDPSVQGRQAADVALEVLRGNGIARGTSAVDAKTPLVVNWKALKRWGIPAERLPAEALVRFRPPSLWDTHRWTIIGVLLVCAFQSGSIGWLLFHRARRMAAERQLAESEERMNLAAGSANLGLWIWDIASDWIWATEKYRALLGFAADERIDFQGLLERLHPADRETAREAVESALNGGLDYDNQYRIRLPDGTERWIAACGRVECGGDGKPALMRGVSQDVTRQKLAEMEIERQRNELAHISRVVALGELSGSLAHELNQPLAAILSNAQAAQRFLAQNPPDLGEVREILGDIVGEDRRAGDVIRRLRALLKGGEFRRVPIAVNEVVEDVLGLVRADLIGKGVAVDRNLAEGLPPVLGDHVQLQQVLLNLILNANDAMAAHPPAARRLGIATARADGMVRVSVTDQGCGLTGGDGERIFQPFFTTKSHGLGMGLAICRTITAAHGGRIWAEPNPGRGTTFHLTLPAIGGEGT